MKFYLAPMEGITGFIFRNAYAKYFGDIDKYITPFISPGMHHSYKSRELRDVLPENNEGLNVTVQMLTNNADDFIHCAKDMKAFGYNEVNLNIGCPSKTVVTKHRGSGFLEDVEKLDAFFDKILCALDGVIDISIKTRLGLSDVNEFDSLIEVFRKYPFSEIIVHPRIQKQMYTDSCNLDKFEKIYNEYLLGDVGKNSTYKTRIVYNGDICTKNDYNKIVNRFDRLENVMIGRGIIANPGLVGFIKEGKMVDVDTLKAFYNEIQKGFLDAKTTPENTVLKMKELYFYLAKSFTNYENYLKDIKHADSIIELKAVMNRLFKEKMVLNN